jgi:Flp pilus assembly protein TadD
MEKLLKLLKEPSWDALLAKTDVWATRFMLTAALLLAIGLAVQAPTESDYLQAGLDAQSQQEYWRAEAFFQQALLLAPHDFQPLLDLGRLHLLEHRDELAQSDLEAARALKSNNAAIWLTMGDVAEDQGQLQDAERAWLQAADLQPTDAQMKAHERLGLLYEHQSRFKDAEAQFSALPGSNALAQYHLGALRLASGNRTGARQAFETTLSETSDPDLLAATRSFLQALDQSNGSAQSETVLGATYIQNNLPTLAVAPLRQAIALAPQDADAHAYLGWSYLRMGLIAQAQSEENQAVALEPGNSFARYTLCLLDLADGHYTSAQNQLILALASDPKNPVLWATSGQIASNLGELLTAEQDFRNAFNDSGGNPQFSVLLATFYADHHMGLENGAALTVARQAIALAPDNAQAFDALGRIQMALYDLPDALNAFSQAALLDPTNATFHEHLGSIQATLNELRSAELNLRKAIFLDFNGPIALQAERLLQTLPPLGI